MDRRFRDRAEAGERLAALLTAYGGGGGGGGGSRGGGGRDDVVVLALPRGGVPVGYAVARALGAPLDVLVVRKLGAPYQPELALGALASGGVRVLNRDVVEGLEIPDDVVAAITARESEELERRERLYRGGAPARDVRGRTVLLVDDGVATGATLRAAIAAVRARDPAAVVVAAPVAPRSVCAELREDADDCVCVATPSPFHGVGRWYHDFAPVPDDEIALLLARSREEAGAAIA